MDLFELASTYSSFGYHRTGSETQLATEAWLSACLNGIASQVEYFNFDYLHFDAYWALNLDGRTVTSIPLYYESLSELRHCSNVEIAKIGVDFEEYSAYQSIRSSVKQAQACNADALIAATDCVNDSLYALNVLPVLKNSLPVILVSGSEFQNLGRSRVSLNYSAQVEQRQARNVIATFGPVSSQPRIIITTPISGWFECAGERSTGVALAIALAEFLSRSSRVELVLASGHELGYLGGFKYTESLRQSPAAVIHLGSSLATIDSSLEAWSNIGGCTFDDLQFKLRQQGIQLNKVSQTSQRSDWVGEAECWSQFNCPMLSIAGSHPLFHTPEDCFAMATNKEELTRVFTLLTELATIVEKGLDSANP